MSKDSLRKFIIRKLAGDFKLSEDQKSFRLDLKIVTATIRKEILEEGEKWGFDEVHTLQLLDEILSNISQCYAPRNRSLQYLNPREIASGTVLVLVGTEGNIGIAELELLSMGNGQFFLLNAHRKGLHSEDMLTIADNRIWGVGHCAFFKVKRNGSPFPDDKRVYRTFPLSEIRLKEPSEIIEIADSKSNFTFRECQLDALSNEKLCLANNPMSLLLDNNSGKGIIDVEFDANGDASFCSDPNVEYPPSAKRNSLFKFNSVGSLENTVVMSTRIPGKISINEQGEIIITEKAEVTVKSR